MKRLIAALFIVAGTFHVSAADGGGAKEKDRDDPKYPVSAISEDLLEDAHVVIRLYDREFIIHSRSKTTLREHMVITIFNEKGEDYGHLVEMYDSDSRITSFEAWNYDKEGNEINKLRKSDIEDYSAVSGVSLYEDNRVKYADMTRQDYPYTVEYIVEKEFDKYYGIHDFFPVTNVNVAVESAQYAVISPSDLMPRYRAVNFEDNVTKTRRDGAEVLMWKLSDIRAVDYEPFNRGLRELVPHVQLAPTKFEFSGYPGDMSSWESFGEWIARLNEGRDELPEDVKEKVKQITAGLAPRDKVKAVYEYMQNRTRYVSIQLGIGGLQPFPAQTVNSTGYGDCKALSNYTYSLLKAAGIHSYYTLVEAGEDPSPVSLDFPNDTFNHVILCVPMEQDTVWLECTSQINPFNYLGTFTGNREVLIITEDGGKVVKTPRYDGNDNQLVRKAQVNIDESGNARVHVESMYKGIHYDLSGLEFRIHEGAEDQKKWVLRNTKVPNFDLQKFRMENNKAEIPDAKVFLEIDVARYASKTGKRFYFVPNLMSRAESNYTKIEDRKSSFKSHYDLVYHDTVEYIFSSGYQMEYLPEPMSIESEFGRYEAKMEFIQGKLIYMRRLEIYEGEYPADKYNDFVDFYEKIKFADKSKVVFTTKT